MTNDKSMLGELGWAECYKASAIDDVLTPALMIYPEIVASNIERTVELLGGDPDRWRVHLKTAKLGFTVQILVQHGIRNFKCATTLELLVACQCGATDILVAHPSTGANARRVTEIAGQFPGVRISVLAESEEHVRQWRGSSVGIFLDINPGMNRTGIEQGHGSEVVKLAQAVAAGGLEFCGLHYYDGQYASVEEPERTAATHRGYHGLMKLAGEVEQSGIHVAEVITAGTPTFPCSLSYQGFRNAGFIHRISPGTVVYCDATSMAQLPAQYGYRPAALVVTRVVSHPRAGLITCDAGHKAVSADAGVPTCLVVGHPELTPLRPSEEHLPMEVEQRSVRPQIGEVLYLLPRHVCPTVNNFDHALVVEKGEIAAVERVTARGHEFPVLGTVDNALPQVAKQR